MNRHLRHTPRIAAPRAEALQECFGRRNCFRGRLVQPIEIVRMWDASGFEVETKTRELAAQDLRCVMLRTPMKILGRKQPDHPPRPGAASATCTLPRRSSTDSLHFK